MKQRDELFFLKYRIIRCLIVRKYFKRMEAMEKYIPDRFFIFKVWMQPEEEIIRQWRELFYMREEIWKKIAEKVPELADTDMKISGWRFLYFWLK